MLLDFYFCYQTIGFIPAKEWLVSGSFRVLQAVPRLPDIRPEGMPLPKSRRAYVLKGTLLGLTLGVSFHHTMKTVAADG